MTVTFKLKDERSCNGCPLLSKNSWNTPWFCTLNFGVIPFEVNGLRRPRPEKCSEHFKTTNVFIYEG